MLLRSWSPECPRAVINYVLWAVGRARGVREYVVAAVGAGVARERRGRREGSLSASGPPRNSDDVAKPKRSSRARARFSRSLVGASRASSRRKTSRRRAAR